MDEDIALMLQVKQDELGAYEKLYCKHCRAIGNFFLRMGCGQDAAEDCVQEVFMRIWRARYNYEPRAKFTTYAFQIAKNYWINEHHKKKRRPTTFHLENNNYNDDSISQEEFFADNSPPEEEVLTRELNEKIQEAVNALSQNYKMVFVLSQFEGFKYREIAEILEIPIGTVKSRMSTAEKKLREKLEHYI